MQCSGSASNAITMIGMFIHVDTTQFTIESVIQSFTAKGGVLDNAIKTGALTVMADMKARIHEEGKAADGSDIGTYSTKPIYVNPANSPRKFPTVGKTGKSIFTSGEKKGQKHKTKYFAEGYSDFKTTIGRNEIGKVNLFLTGGLSNGFTLIETEKGFGLGFINDELVKRSLALEVKYGKEIWAVSEPEAEVLVKAVQNAIKF
jgi:hypothetical protein